ncbi:collagen-like protein [Streptomyces sp. N2-109]|uniref:Collagen-like protein n=1 Tax=Streptomyces gossypii TaxID=2883101 RepID=A0ABT2JUX9_9ACTN|nr:collagen-like protein [Streptomyces gossypii]MCT2591160.1 collagen-like protein [Streptomyces gossypii]
MTRTERVLARRWRPVLLACVLVALAGAVVMVWARVDRADGRADDLRTEADRRGTAVSTLAGDVRTLRAQLAAEGETPDAPDPSEAVDDLPDRAEVPVPIPGPSGADGKPGRRGPAGEQGSDGGEGQDGSDGESGPAGDPGTDGEAGQDGADGPQGETGPAGPPGPAGPGGERGPAGEQGPAGERGPAGETGPAGPTCPDGYSLQAPADDPDALVCRRDGAPDPDQPGNSGPKALAVDRRQYP